MSETLSPVEELYFENRGAAPIQKEPEAAPEAPPEEAQDAVQPAEQVEPDVGDDAQPKNVPLKALHSERDRRKAAEQKARELELRLARLEGRMEQPQPQASQPAAPDEIQIPDPEEDVFGAVKGTAEEVRRMRAEIQRQQQETAQRIQVERIQTAYRSEGSALISADPEFKTAYEHLIRSRQEELTALGYTDPAAREQIIQRDELQFFLAVKQQGRDLGETLKQYAKARGWQASKPQPPAPKTDPNEKPKTLSGTGTSPSGPMTVDRLIAMGEREFSAYYDKNPETVRRLMGG